MRRYSIRIRFCTFTFLTVFIFHIVGSHALDRYVSGLPEASEDGPILSFLLGWFDFPYNQIANHVWDVYNEGGQVAMETFWVLDAAGWGFVAAALLYVGLRVTGIAKESGEAEQRGFDIVQVKDKNGLT